MPQDAELGVFRALKEPLKGFGGLASLELSVRENFGDLSFQGLPDEGLAAQTLNVLIVPLHPPPPPNQPQNP